MIIEDKNEYSMRKNKKGNQIQIWEGVSEGLSKEMTGKLKGKEWSLLVKNRKAQGIAWAKAQELERALKRPLS